MEDFETMRLIADEVNRDIVYKLPNGCFNFEVLEGLLRIYDFMTLDQRGNLEEIKNRLGLDYVRLEEMLGNAKAIAGIIEDVEYGADEVSEGFTSWLERLVKRPEYEFLHEWYQWVDFLDPDKENSEGSIKIDLKDGWRMVYHRYGRQIQIAKSTDEEFLSLVGPKMNIRNIPDSAMPFFEIYNRKVCIQGITSYTDARQLFITKFGRKPPTESEIEDAILSYDKYSEELAAAVQGKQGMYYAVNTCVPKIDGNRILGPMDKRQIENKRAMCEERPSIVSPDNGSAPLKLFLYTDSKFVRLNAA